jgi:hypothetical protein
MFDAECAMRTTLSLDDDVLQAARALAERSRQSLGEVVSGLARQALTASGGFAEAGPFPLLPVSNPKAQVTLETVNRLRDEAC